MPRLNWDRLRRARPLDGADVRIDADGEHLWEREQEGAALPLGAQRLRHGVIIRRRQERAQDAVRARTDLSATSLERVAREVAEKVNASVAPIGPVRCRLCGAKVSPRKLLRHRRRCPKREA